MRVIHPSRAGARLPAMVSLKTPKDSRASPAPTVTRRANHNRRDFSSELVGRRQTDHVAGSLNLAIQGRATQAIYVLGIDRSVFHKLVRIGPIDAQPRYFLDLITKAQGSEPAVVVRDAWVTGRIAGRSLVEGHTGAQGQAISEPI